MEVVDEDEHGGDEQDDDGFGILMQGIEDATDIFPVLSIVFPISSLSKIPVGFFSASAFRGDFGYVGVIRIRRWVCG